MTLSHVEQREHLTLAAQIAGLAGVDIVVPDARYVRANGLRLHYLD